MEVLSLAVTTRGRCAIAVSVYLRDQGTGTASCSCPRPTLMSRCVSSRSGPGAQSLGSMPTGNFFEHPSNRKLAKQVVYTDGKAPEETRDDVLQFLPPSPLPAT